MHLVRFPTCSESFSDLRDHYHFTRVCGLLDRILSDLVFIGACLLIFEDLVGWLYLSDMENSRFDAIGSDDLQRSRSTRFEASLV